jgi:1-deoxy-D-xylulose-5-phosphate reductoisomerase
MNKGFEVIEAKWLFGLEPDRIRVVVHPESVIHSMVEFADGAVIAQLGCPDMRQPIGFALGFPQRLSVGNRKLDFAELGRLSFEAPDTSRFPCLQLAYDALRRGGNAPCTLNAANDVAVAAYLKDLPLHPSQVFLGEDEDGRSLFAMRVIPNPNLVMELCKHGNRLEVLEPATLRAQVAAELRNALEIYERNK